MGTITDCVAVCDMVSSADFRSRIKTIAGVHMSMCSAQVYLDVVTLFVLTLGFLNLAGGN